MRGVPRRVSIHLGRRHDCGRIPDLYRNRFLRPYNSSSVNPPPGVFLTFPARPSPILESTLSCPVTAPPIRYEVRPTSPFRQTPPPPRARIWTDPSSSVDRSFPPVPKARTPCRRRFWVTSQPLPHTRSGPVQGLKTPSSVLGGDSPVSRPPTTFQTQGEIFRVGWGG